MAYQRLRHYSRNCDQNKFDYELIEYKDEYDNSVIRKVDIM